MQAAVYARKSTDQGGVAEDQKSVTRQIETAKAYAARKGWTVDDRYVFFDDGISGAEFSKRPDFLRLMNALKPKPPFQVLIMSEESRLGREQLEVGYALKQIMQAGVRVFFYMEDRERTLDSPTDKIMLSLAAFADELEREKARQRVTDAMTRKARAGHVTGGAVFGYRNIEVQDQLGNRSHVDRQIVEREAEIIRHIFQRCASGQGFKAIAKELNALGAPSPRAQQGRSQSWAPSSVREVLLRDHYRGHIVYNQTRKRDRWGQHKQTARPESDWIITEKPDLRIVPEELWSAAHQRIETARAVYMKTSTGGRPAMGSPAKYLLTTLALCGRCGGPLQVSSRPHGKTGRRLFYCCSNHRERGVCSNDTFVPMDEANGAVIDVAHDALGAKVLEDAAALVIERIQDDRPADRLKHLEAELQQLDRQVTKLSRIILEQEDVDSLVKQLQETERRRKALRVDRDAIVAQSRQSSRNVGRLREDLLGLAGSWRTQVTEDVGQARAIIAAMLDGRVTFTPVEGMRRLWTVTGRTTLGSLIGKVLDPDTDWNGFLESGKDGVEEWICRNGVMRPASCAVGMASPMGFEPMFWP